MPETTANASIDIAATPAAVYNLLTDLARISELSPECYRAEWEDGATTATPGAKFRGFNRNDKMEWDAGCVVVTADPGKEWAFEVPADDGRGTEWRWQIEETDNGCRVTETFVAPMLDGEFFQKINRYQTLVGNISQSLSNLKDVLES